MNARVNVMHVIEAMHQGGAEAMVVEHVTHAGAGYRTLVCAINRGGPALEAAAAGGARTFVLGRAGGPLLRVPRRIFTLARIMRRERVAVVNGHNPGGALYGVLAARLAGVRVVLRTEHSLHYPGRHSFLYRFVEPVLTLFTRRVVCVCRAVLESHARRLPWAARRFVTVANGISPTPHTRPREAVRGELGIRAGAPLAVAVGSLTPQKDHATLLNAFAKVAPTLPDARLCIVGEGPLRDALERTRTALGLDTAVLFAGRRDDTPDVMGAADVFVLSSRREGLSVSLLEAMRAGRCVVATDVGGNAELVKHGVTGQLVPPGDADALAAAITACLSDPARMADTGRAARARWEQSCGADRMVRETEALYSTAAPHGEARNGHERAAAVSESRT